MSFLPEQVSVFDPSVDDADDVAGRQLTQLIGGYVPAQVVSAVARLGVADELTPAGRSAGDLGRALHLPAAPLARLLRAAATFGLVGLHPDGRFAATAMSQRLRTGAAGSLRDTAIGFSLPPT